MLVTAACSFANRRLLQ